MPARPLLATPPTVTPMAPVNPDPVTATAVPPAIRSDRTSARSTSATGPAGGAGSVAAEVCKVGGQLLQLGHAVLDGGRIVDALRHVDCVLQGGNLRGQQLWPIAVTASVRS